MSQTKIDWTKPVQTREGRKVRVLCTDMKHPNYSVVVIVTDEDGVEREETYTIEGYYSYSNTTGTHECDLINIPETKVSFTAVFSQADGTPYTGASYSTKDNLNTYSSERYRGILELRNTAGKIETVFHPKQS